MCIMSGSILKLVHLMFLFVVVELNALILARSMQEIRVLYVCTLYYNPRPMPLFVPREYCS